MVGSNWRCPRTLCTLHLHRLRLLPRSIHRELMGLRGVGKAQWHTSKTVPQYANVFCPVVACIPDRSGSLQKTAFSLFFIQQGLHAGGSADAAAALPCTVFKIVRVFYCKQHRIASCNGPAMSSQGSDDWSNLCEEAYNGKSLSSLLDAARVSCGITVRRTCVSSTFLCLLTFML
jgi:hypothetical protein